MTDESIRPDIVFPGLPAAPIIALAIAGMLLAWLVQRRLRRRAPTWTLRAARLAVTACAAWCALQALARVVELQTPWSLTLWALIAGLGLEAIDGFYERERRACSARIGRRLLMLRLTAFAVLLLILLQPVMVRHVRRHVARRVLVLLDDSASMHSVDRLWEPDELLDLGRAFKRVPPTAEWGDLDAAQRSAIETFSATTRVAIAEHLLTDMPTPGVPVLQRLAEHYDVDVMRFASGIRRYSANGLEGATGNDGDEALSTRQHDDRPLDIAPDVVTDDPGADAEAVHSFRALTDMTGALESVLRDTPSEELAGVLFLTDGIHNAETGMEAVARRYAMQHSRISAVIIGGSRTPFDLAIDDVQAPESVYLGDRIRFRAVVRAGNAQGRLMRVRLMLDGEPVDEQAIEITSDEWTVETRLTHHPDRDGVLHYTLEIDPLDGELFVENNSWPVDVAVSDDRTNVLLVEHYPRWEYRYLRNLFFGRDRAVHLQYLLLSPDHIANADPLLLPPASAAREFGDAEAGALPVSREEWRRFDVIILGDLPPSLLDAATQEHIEHCVTERGALLVVIAGPRYMPHAFMDGPLADLIPVVADVSLHDAGMLAQPEAAFRMELAPAGITHPIMQQSASLLENEALWGEFPVMRWRLPIADIKPGGDVLAYAVPVRGDASDPGDGIADVVARIESRMAMRVRNALLVARHHGRGKVLMLNTDRTWRLRYREGDTYHHRFWGQAIRWGAAESLRAGNAEMRLGTDRLRYTPDETVSIIARLIDPALLSPPPPRLDAVVERDDRIVARVALTLREGSEGMYEGTLAPLGSCARYTVRIEPVDGSSGNTVQTALSVVPARRPVELARVSATPDIMRQAAELSGGVVVTPSETARLANAFGDARRVITERRDWPLWQTPVMFILLFGLLAAEWIVRKRGGLT